MGWGQFIGKMAKGAASGALQGLGKGISGDKTPIQGQPKEDARKDTSKPVEGKSVKKPGFVRQVIEGAARGFGSAFAGGEDEKPNYVSRDDLHVPRGAASGVSHAGERVPYKVSATWVGEGGYDEVKPTALAPNPVERSRQKNNRARDQRTNLGRGKPGIIEVE